MSNSCIFDEKIIIDFIKKNSVETFTKNLFLFDSEKCGIDNIYMGNIKTKHRGGDSKSMPSTRAGMAKQQKPGSAEKNPTSSMKWSRGVESDMRK